MEVFQQSYFKRAHATSSKDHSNYETMAKKDHTLGLSTTHCLDLDIA